MHGEHPVEIRGRQVGEQGLMHDAGIVDEMGGIAKCGAAKPRRSPSTSSSRETSPDRGDRVSALRFDFRGDGFGLHRNAGR